MKRKKFSEKSTTHLKKEILKEILQTLIWNRFIKLNPMGNRKCLTFSKETQQQRKSKQSTTSDQNRLSRK